MDAIERFEDIQAVDVIKEKGRKSPGNFKWYTAQHHALTAEVITGDK